MMATVLCARIDPTNYADSAKRVVKWSGARDSRYVCIANVHMLMEAWDNPSFANVLWNADLVTPDGMPLVWVMRAKGDRGQQRVYGPTLMLYLLEAAVQENLSVGFYGSTPNVLDSLVKAMQAKHPRLNVAFVFSPRYGNLSQREDNDIVGRINESGARILFVGLGCPKQEMWMAEHRGKVQAVMLGVGAAFDFHAGLKPQAPAWMQRIGLEWFFRFVHEPQRLWRRYLVHNPRFVFLAIADLLGLLR